MIDREAIKRQRTESRRLLGLSPDELEAEVLASMLAANERMFADFAELAELDRAILADFLKTGNPPDGPPQTD